MDCENFKSLPRRRVSVNILREETFNINEMRNMMYINEILLQWLTNVLIRSPFRLQVNLPPAFVLKTSMLNQKVAKDLFGNEKYTHIL